MTQTGIITDDADRDKREGGEWHEEAEWVSRRSNEQIRITPRTDPRMHIQIITFSLEGISEQDYLQSIESAAPAFAELPGLVSKTWLANAETNTYGGVYLWQDRESMEGYFETDVFKQMEANPYFKEFTVREFDVPEGPSRITRGLAQATA